MKIKRLFVTLCTREAAVAIQHIGERPLNLPQFIDLKLVIVLCEAMGSTFPHTMYLYEV